VLNRFGKPVSGFFIHGTYSYNNLQNPFILMRKIGDFNPVAKSDKYFSSYYLHVGYNNIFLEIGNYFKNYPSGGVYAKGWNPDGSMVVGYDESNVRIEQIKSNYYCLQILFYSGNYLDISGSVSYIPYLIGEGSPYYTFILSKSMTGYSYSFGVEAPSTFFYLPLPLIPFASCSYEPINNLSIFWEGKYSLTYNDSQYATGYTNVTGLNYNIIKYINLSVFHHYFYDNREYKIPYSRHDSRFGFQISFMYLH
jgi:hypothetical protein